MNKITVSAPGKLLLLGDHAVVYGKPCLVTAVSERLSVSLFPSHDDAMHFDTPDVSDTRFVTAAIAAAQDSWGHKLPPVVVATKSGFSGNYGLGSSAAVTVATLYAIAEYIGRKVAPDELFRLSHTVILAVQKVGSGFDAASAIRGGTIWYERLGRTITPVANEHMPLIVGFTGVKADTAAIVADIAKKYAAQKERVNRIFDAIAALVSAAREKMAEGDWERVGKLMDFNQEYLRDLGVSSEKLETLISAAKGAGAWGAKLSGAGGGDCMIAVAPEDKRIQIEKAIETACGQVIHIMPNAPGVRREL